LVYTKEKRDLKTGKQLADLDDAESLNLGKALIELII